jgi:sugar phosphate isomerase/epimerase
MPAPNTVSRVAACSWSLQPSSAADLVEKLAATGVKQLQIALDPIREHPEAWQELRPLCAKKGITCVSGMFATVGEDYSTLEAIRRTGGLVPDQTWAENWRNIQADAHNALVLGLKLLTFHAGFLPHEETDLSFSKLFQRITQIAHLFSQRGISLGFETGQENAETLRAFLRTLRCANVGVNFDPANMILYDKGDPVHALRVLGPWLRQCHIKDARRTKVPGTWGEEVVVGTGEVDWPAFFRTLGELRFTGHLCIEREAGTQRAADIRTAREFMEKQGLH